MGSQPARHSDQAQNGAVDGPFSDPVAESRRLIAAARLKGLTIRVLGGVAVSILAPNPPPPFARPIGDIDVAARKGTRRAIANLLTSNGYLADQMFNAVHGSSRMLFRDPVNTRKLDVFLGEFSMCHTIPIADRLDREQLTIPLAELILTKLQIVELTERDQRDIYNLVFHHHVGVAGEAGIEADYIASSCAKDWGLWRTVTATVVHCLASITLYPIAASDRRVIEDRLSTILRYIDQSPKPIRWQVRNRIGERMRWYESPETEPDAV